MSDLKFWNFYFHSYEGESINNQPNTSAIIRDIHDFHALFQYMYYYLGAKLHMYTFICLLDIEWQTWLVM